MKNTLLIVITALFALAADKAELKMTDTQKLRLARIEGEFMTAKSGMHEAEVNAAKHLESVREKATVAMQQLQARHAAEIKAILLDLKAGKECTVVKQAPDGLDGKPIEGASPDWAVKCAEKPAN